MTKETVAPGLEYVTLKRAARMIGLDEQEVLDLAAAGRIRPGIIAARLACHAVPMRESSEAFFADVEDRNGSVVGTRYRIVPAKQPTHTVDVIYACKFWEIGGQVAGFLGAAETLEIHFLRPREDTGSGEIKQFMPWPESMMALVEPHTITRADLRFYAADVERFNVGHGIGTRAASQPDTAQSGVELVPPQRCDDWADCIIAAAKAYLDERDKWPTEGQLWRRLRTNPPEDYGVEPRTDRGERALSLGGDNPLDRAAFRKRYNNYFPPIAEDKAPIAEDSGG